MVRATPARLVTGPPSTRSPRLAGDDRWLLFGGAAVLLVTWTLALAVLVPRPGGRRPSRARHPPSARGPVISASPDGGSLVGAGPAMARPTANGASTQRAPGTAAHARTNDASDPAAAGPPSTRDAAVMRLAMRWLAAFGDWEVGRGAASARRVLRATSTPALAWMVTRTAPRAEGPVPGPASVGRPAAFVTGRGFTVIAELHRAHEAVAIELDVVRAAGGLRISGFDL